MVFQKSFLKSSFQTAFSLALFVSLLESASITPSQAMDDENPSPIKRKSKKSETQADTKPRKRSKTERGTIKRYRLEEEDDSAVMSEAVEETQVGVYKLTLIEEEEISGDAPVMAEIVEEPRQSSNNPLNGAEYLQREILNPSYFVDRDALTTTTTATHSSSTTTTSGPYSVHSPEPSWVSVRSISILQHSTPQPYAIPPSLTRNLPSSLQGRGLPQAMGGHPFFFARNNGVPMINPAISIPPVNINFFNYSSDLGMVSSQFSFTPPAFPPVPVLQQQRRANVNPVVAKKREKIDDDTFAELRQEYRDVRTREERQRAVKELYESGVTRASDIAAILKWNREGVDIAFYQVGIKKMDLGNLQIRKMMKLCAAGWTAPQISKEPDIDGNLETIKKNLSQLTMSSEYYQHGRRLEQTEIDKIEVAYNSGIELKAIKKKYPEIPPYRIERLCEVLNKLKLYDLTHNASSNQ